MQGALRIATIVAAFFSVVISVVANDCAPHPTDTTAQLLGSFTDTLYIDGAGSYLAASNDRCFTTYVVCVFLTSGGRIDYVIDASSIAFDGECDDVDTISTADLFDRITREAIAKGIDLGYSSCPDSCSTTSTTRPRVYSNACVQRSGSGSSTAFTPCSTLFCWRQYAICCPPPAGTPQITPLPGTSGCATPPIGCEATCP